MKHLLIILSFLLLCSPLFGQSGKPQTIIIPTGSLGEMSKARIKILEKTLESKLDDYFAIVPKELFEEAHNNLAISLVHIGNIERAIAHFRKALHINPDFVTAKNNLKKVLMLMEKQKK